MTTSCYFCNEIERLQEHHIVPRRFDGSDDEENLVKLCPTCHDKIENLYNKRFYDALGVEKPQNGESEFGLCQNSECYGDASNRVSGPAGSLEVCDMHDGCDRGRCDNKATTTRQNEPGITFLCEEHSVCQSDECSSTTTVLVCKDDGISDTTKVYCRGHVPEDTTYASYTVIADE